MSRLEIQLDHEAGQHELLPLPAGSMLTGRVVAETTKPLDARRFAEQSFDSPPARPAVTLRFYGKEKVRMNFTKATRVSGVGHATKCAERNILDLQLEWPTFPSQAPNRDVVEPGTFVFPFCIDLPATIPSSTHYPINDNRARSKMRFRIQYKLLARINNVERNKSNKPIYSKARYVWISASAPDPMPEPVPCLVEPTAHEIKGGGLFKRGTVLFGAAMDNCCVSDILHLRVSCRNDSSVDISRVQVEILEKLTWGTTAVRQRIDPKTGACIQSAALTQTQTNLLCVIRDVQLPGLACQRKGFLKGAFQAIVSGGDNSGVIARLQQQIYGDLTDTSLHREQNQIAIRLPEKVRESYAGQLVQVSHFVRIRFHTVAQFSKNPMVEIPIYILAVAKPHRPTTLHSSGAGEAYQVDPPSPLPEPATSSKNYNDNNNNNAQPEAVLYEPEIVLEHCRSNDSCAVPLVEVQPLPIPENAVAASMAVSSADVVVLGGDAILPQESRRRLEDLIPLPPPNAVSLDVLLLQMRASINDYDLISEKLANEAWKSLFEELKPVEFGSIIEHVSVDFEQPRVAFLLASRLQSGLTCEYIAACVRKTSGSLRAVMVQRLLPLCIDVDKNLELISAELNQWEQTVALSTAGS